MPWAEQQIDSSERREVDEWEEAWEAKVRRNRASLKVRLESLEGTFLECLARQNGNRVQGSGSRVQGEQTGGAGCQERLF